MAVEKDLALTLAFPPIASPEGGQLQLAEVSPRASMGVLGFTVGDLPQVIVKSATPSADGQPRLLEVSTAEGQI